MENGLTTTLQALRQQRNEIARNRAKTIYAICRNVTPQFYSKQTPDEMETMVNTIHLLIRGIPENILTKMCNLAVEAYAGKKARNAKEYFDINYILSFYNQAWDEARPEGYVIVYRCDVIDGRLKRVGYGKCEDYDINEGWKPNADIWWDER